MKYSIEIRIPKHHKLYYDHDSGKSFPDLLEAKGFSLTTREHSNVDDVIVMESNDPPADLSTLKRLRLIDADGSIEIHIFDKEGFIVHSGDSGTAFDLKDLQAQQRKAIRKRCKLPKTPGSIYRMVYEDGLTVFLKYLANWTVEFFPFDSLDLFAILDVRGIDTGDMHALDNAPWRWGPLSTNLKGMQQCGNLAYIYKGTTVALDTLPPFRHSPLASMAPFYEPRLTSPKTFHDWSIWWPAGGRIFTGGLKEEDRRLEFLSPWMPLGLAERLKKGYCDQDFCW
jgi:hypothetical protein